MFLSDTSYMSALWRSYCGVINMKGKYILYMYMIWLVYRSGLWHYGSIDADSLQSAYMLGMYSICQLSIFNNWSCFLGKREIFCIQGHWLNSSCCRAWYRETQNSCVWTSESLVSHERSWTQVQNIHGKFIEICTILTLIWVLHCNSIM